MPSSLDKVIAILKFLELTPHVREYRGRFFIQKMAFLAPGAWNGYKVRFYRLRIGTIFASVDL